MQISRYFHQCFQSVFNKVLTGHHGWVFYQQLFKGLIVALFQFQPLHLVSFLDRCEMQLMMIGQILVLLTLVAEGLDKDDIVIQVRTNIHHATPLAFHLFTIVTANGLLYLITLALVLGG